MNFKYRYGIQIISYNRPNYLETTISSLMKVIDPNLDKIAIIEQSDKDDNQQTCLSICQKFKNISVYPLFNNFGQRGATNYLASLGFWNDCKYVMLSDHDNLFKTDLSVYCEYLDSNPLIWITTGLHSPEHDLENKFDNWILKSTCRAGHIVMRSSDFLSLIPIDEKMGSCSWFAGLDWSLTHWCEGTPGYSRSQFIACYIGGVEHIGRDSCWQGHYDDEYSEDQLNDFKNLSLYDIIHKYPPRHTYIKDKYWYEELTDDELYKKYSFVNLNFDNYSQDIVFDKISEYDFKTLSFNYVWPKYNISFLEKSIESALKITDAYLLIINTKSYTGESISLKDVTSLFELINSKFKDSNVFIIVNEVQMYDECKDDNAQFYLTQIANFCSIKTSIEYILLIQSDEIYDDAAVKSLKDLISSGEHKAWITNPICYFDTPNWRISPIEEYRRISLLSIEYFKFLKYDYSLISREKTYINFHHLSYVLDRNELSIKLNNWGHKRDFSKTNLKMFKMVFETIKTNKSLEDFHPIIPELYHSLKYDPSDYNSELFIFYLQYLCNSLISSTNYFNYTNDLHKLNDSNYCSLVNYDLCLFHCLINNFIPNRSNILICNDNNGNLSKICNIISPKSKIYNVYTDLVINQKQLIQNSIKYNFNIIYSDSKCLSFFPNNYFDLIFFDFNSYEILQPFLIESWPKLKKYGLMSGSHAGWINSNISNFLTSHIEACPWGNQLFSFFETYSNLTETLTNYANLRLVTSELGIWLARKG